MWPSKTSPSVTHCSVAHFNESENVLSQLNAKRMSIKCGVIAQVSAVVGVVVGAAVGALGTVVFAKSEVSETLSD